VDNIFDLEDVSRNQISHDRKFKHTFPAQRSLLLRILYNSTIGIVFLLQLL
jgi:hypothetical protein